MFNAYFCIPEKYIFACGEFDISLDDWKAHINL